MSATPGTSPKSVISDAEVQKLLQTAQGVLTLLMLDLTIEGDPLRSTCDKVAFTVRLLPAALASIHSETFYMVDVLITDNFGNRITHTYPMSSRGASIVDVLAFPQAVPFPSPQKWDRTYFLEVDPMHRILERNETNNRAAIIRHCIA